MSQRYNLTFVMVNNTNFLSKFAFVKAFLKKIIYLLKKKYLIHISDSDRLASVQKIQVYLYQIFFLFLILLTLLFVVLLKKDSSSIHKKQLLQQSKNIEQLTKRVEQQDRFIKNLQMVLRGNVPVLNDTLPIEETPPTSVKEYKLSPEEIHLAQKVNSENTQKPQKTVIYFPPVKGIVSQKFNSKNHPGIDIVTEKGAIVKSCSRGVVVFSSYTSKDGNVIVIFHKNNEISIYKHNSAVLKNVGDYVAKGDPIAIVGNTGAQSDGPHLHFELWKKGKAINPETFIDFND